MPARPRRPPQRIRADRLKDQVTATGTVLAPHRPLRRCDHRIGCRPGLLCGMIRRGYCGGTCPRCPAGGCTRLGGRPFRADVALPPCRIGAGAEGDRPGAPRQEDRESRAGSGGEGGVGGRAPLGSVRWRQWPDARRASVTASRSASGAAPFFQVSASWSKIVSWGRPASSGAWPACSRRRCQAPACPMISSSVCRGTGLIVRLM